MPATFWSRKRTTSTALFPSTTVSQSLTRSPYLLTTWHGSASVRQRRRSARGLSTISKVLTLRLTSTCWNLVSKLDQSACATSRFPQCSSNVELPAALPWPKSARSSADQTRTTPSYHSWKKSPRKPSCARASSKECKPKLRTACYSSWARTKRKWLKFVRLAPKTT